jgi:sporulation protein YlmC with PRC-barrel domain
MKAVSTILGCVGLSVVLAAPAFAQQATSNATVATNQQATNAPNGSLQKYHDKWRASKLVGANVYNQNGQTVGSIDDLLVGEDGKISDAVLSVGGFLGIGGKLVSVPFDQFKFEESRRSTAVNDMAAPAPAIAPATTTAAPATATRTPVTTTAGTPNREMTSEEPVYYSIVLPDATKNSLTSAAEFKYNG